MRLLRCFLAVFLALLTCAHGQARDQRAQTDWHNLEGALRSGQVADLKRFVGRRVEFEGVVIDPFIDKERWLRPNPLQVKVYRVATEGRPRIDTGIVCHIMLRDDEIKPVAGCPAAAISVRVVGVVVNVAPEGREVRIQSQKTVVTYAD